MAVFVVSAGHARGRGSKGVPVPARYTTFLDLIQGREQQARTPYSPQAGTSRFCPPQYSPRPWVPTKDLGRRRSVFLHQWNPVLHQCSPRLHQYNRLLVHIHQNTFCTLSQPLWAILRFRASVAGTSGRKAWLETPMRRVLSKSTRGSSFCNSKMALNILGSWRSVKWTPCKSS